MRGLQPHDVGTLDGAVVCRGCVGGGEKDRSWKGWVMEKGMGEGGGSAAVLAYVSVVGGCACQEHG